MKKFIFSALIFCLLLTVCRSLSHSTVLLDRIVATVNNEAITWSELRKTVELESKESLRNLTEEEKEKKLNDLEKQFLDILIDMKLQLQEARKIGYSVSPAEINEAIEDIKSKYGLTDESLTESLKAENLTLEEYREKLKEQITISKLVRFEVRNKILISDKAIEEYYEAHRKVFQNEEQFRIRQILFLADSSSKKPEVEAKAQEVLRRIRNGEDFSMLAGEFSDDVSREFGGDLGYVNRSNLLNEIAEAASGLKPGEVSKPFWGPKGLHIIKLEEKKEGDSIDKVRERIKEILFEKVFQSKYEDWVKQLREKAYIEIKL